MKKNIMIKGCAALAAVALMSSCDDFLEETPQSTYTTETFYSSESDFQYAVSAIFSAQMEALDAPNGSSSYSMFRFPTVRGDEKSLYDGENCYADGAESMKDDASGTNIKHIWQYMYIMITRANGVLDRIDDFQFSDATLKNTLKGQALAMRAYAYDQLGHYFGGVPVLTKEMGVAEVLQVGKSTQEEVFAQALSDYKAASELVKDKYDGKEYGYIGKYACYAAMGRLYLYKKDTANAKDYLKKVIDSKLYSLADTYVDCFSEAAEGNGERVWEVVYNCNQPGTGQHITEGMIQESYTYVEGHDYWDYCVGNGGSHAIPVNRDLLKDFEEGDVRRNEYQDGVKTRVKAEENFCLKFSHYATKATSAAYWGINIPVIRYTDVVLMYAECVGASEGAQYLNKVRERAGLGAWDDVYSDWTTALRHERRIEFAYEGLRWWDLIRWGVAIDTMNAYFGTLEGGAAEGKAIYEMKQKNLLFAIPQTEIDLYKGALKQNDGF